MSLNSEYSDIIKHLTSKITHIYNGKVIPNKKHNYLSIISPLTDQYKLTLRICLYLLEQNNYNPEFKIVIISYFNYSNTECSAMIEKINTILPITNNKKEVRQRRNGSLSGIHEDSDCQTLTIIDPSKHFRNNIDSVIPDVVIIDELYNKMAHVYETIKWICSADYLHNTAVISFSKNNYDDLMEYTGIKNTIILYETPSCSDLIRKNNIDLTIKIYDNIDHDILFSKLNNCANKLILKKIVVIVPDDHTVDKYYFEYINSVHKSKTFKYLNLLGITPFNGTIQKHINLFSNLYDYMRTKTFLNYDQYISYVNSIVRKSGNSGIIFITKPMLFESNNILSLKNIDCVVFADDKIKTDKLRYNIILSCLSSLRIKGSCAIIIDYVEKHIYSQLYRIANIFYSYESDSANSYIQLKNNIKTRKLQLPYVLNSSRIRNLEKIFGITQDVKDFHNRHNRIFIVNDISQCGSLSEQYYQFEKQYFNIKIDIQNLMAEFNLINTNKSTYYSGPKWISREDRKEIAGNKLGFIRDGINCNIIELFEIIGIIKFNRHNKRKIWKEKENRDKNILFLSPLICILDLTKIKSDIGSKYTKYIKNLMYVDITSPISCYINS